MTEVNFLTLRSKQDGGSAGIFVGPQRRRTSSRSANPVAKMHFRLLGSSESCPGAILLFWSSYQENGLSLSRSRAARMGFPIRANEYSVG